MYRKLIAKLILLLLLLFAISVVFSTQIYLNNFKVSCQHIIASLLSVNRVEYSYVSGNFMNGFSVTDLSINSDNYICQSKNTYVSLNLSHIFNRTKKIDFVKLEEVDFILKDIPYSETNGEGVESVEIENIHLSYKNNIVFLKKINIKQGKDRRYSLKGQEGRGAFFGCDFNISALDINFLDTYFQYSFKINSFTSSGFDFEKLNFYGEGNSVVDLNGDFKASGMKILNKKFSDFEGEIEYLDNVFSIKLAENNLDSNRLKDYSISGVINIQDTLVNINKLAVEIKNDNFPLLIENETFFVNKDEWHGKNIKLKYKNGNLFAENFKIKNLNDYFFDIKFDRFDINLFKGLKAKGYLTGDLQISANKENNSAIFSNAKIDNFSYEEYSFDSVEMEGAFKNNELALSDLSLSRKIGFLNVSGSFSSLDNFYNKIIHKLKLKIKL